MVQELRQFTMVPLFTAQIPPTQRIPAQDTVIVPESAVFLMIALEPVFAKKPSFMASEGSVVLLMYRLLTVWPAPSKMPLYEVSPLFPIGVQLTVVVELYIDERSMLLSSCALSVV